MEPMMHLFQGAGSLISFVGTIFWIVMMIDCLRSQIQHKGRWMIFMLITNWVGAVVYFFVVRPSILNPFFNFVQGIFQPQRPPYMQPRQSMRQQPPTQTHMDPPAPAAPLYRDYQQGYQPQEPYYQPTSSASQVASQAVPEQSAYYPSYEQPQASYPEMPPMQQ